MGTRTGAQRAILPKPEVDPQDFQVMLAGLCRFYGGTPGGYLAMPLYQLRVLVENQAALEAREQAALVTAVSVPHWKDNDRRRYVRQLGGLSRRLHPQPPAPPTPTEYDPAKAAEWFAAHGYEVSDG